MREAPGSIPNTEKTNKPKLTIMKASHREPTWSGSEQGWPGEWTVVNDRHCPLAGLPWLHLDRSAGVQQGMDSGRKE